MLNHNDTEPNSASPLSRARAEASRIPADRRAKLEADFDEAERKAREHSTFQRR